LCFHNCSEWQFIVDLVEKAAASVKHSPDAASRPRVNVMQVTTASPLTQMSATTLMRRR
jgi:hypothetical protein